MKKKNVILTIGKPFTIVKPPKYKELFNILKDAYDGKIKSSFKKVFINGKECR